MSNLHYCIIGNHPPGKGNKRQMVDWQRIPVVFKDGQWQYNPKSTTTIECCPNHRPHGYVPTDEAIKRAFANTADAICGDMYHLHICRDEAGEFQMERDVVVEYLDIHGSNEVSEWCFSMSCEELHQELDRIGVPKYWTE